MIKKRALFSFILIGFFSLLVTPVFALEGYGSVADNRKYLGEGIKHAEAALASAKNSEAKQVQEHSQASIDIMKEINSEEWAPFLQKATGRLRLSSIKAKKGDTEKAAELLEQALVALKRIK